MTALWYTVEGLGKPWQNFEVLLTGTRHGDSKIRYSNPKAALIPIRAWLYGDMFKGVIEPCKTLRCYDKYTTTKECIMVLDGGKGQSFHLMPGEYRYLRDEGAMLREEDWHLIRPRTERRPILMVSFPLMEMDSHEEG